MRAVAEYLSGLLGGAALGIGLLAMLAVFVPVEPRAPAPPGAFERGAREAPRPGTGYAVSRVRWPGPVAGAPPSVEAGLRRGVVVHEGRRWRYRLLASRRAWSGVASPVVVLLHGTGRGGDAASLLAAWRDTAEGAGLLVVAPEAAGGVWRGRREGPGFAHALLAEIAAGFRIDPARIYLFGHDDGAQQALALANAAPALWAAAAVHGGALPPGQVRAVRGRVPDLALFIGTEDRVFPLDAVHRSAAALAGAGHAVTVTEIAGHAHGYGEAWRFLTDRVWGFFRTR